MPAVKEEDEDEAYTALIQTLEKVKHHDYALLRLSESIASAPPDADHTRTSDVSSYDSSTPHALQADLTHYKELFSKLRFSYLEQVTKEKFLRAITDDPPLVVSPGENTALERSLVSAKTQLKQAKADVAAILTELETLSRRLAGEYGIVDGYGRDAVRLRGGTKVLEGRIGVLRGEMEAVEGDMTLAETVGALAEREAELAALERELGGVEREVPRRRRVLGGLEGEVGRLERERVGLEVFVNEAVRMRGEARREGRADGETMGRWYKAVYEGLEGLVGGEVGGGGCGY